MREEEFNQEVNELKNWYYIIYKRVYMYMLSLNVVIEKFFIINF